MLEENVLIKHKFQFPNAEVFFEVNFIDNGDPLEYGPGVFTNSRLVCGVDPRTSLEFCVDIFTPENLRKLANELEVKYNEAIIAKKNKLSKN